MKDQEFTLHVHHVSHMILLHEHTLISKTPPTIHINKRDALLIQLLQCSRPLRVTIAQEKMYEIMVESDVEFELSDYYAQSLFNYHMDTMVRFMHAQSALDTDMGAQTAMKRWYEVYHVDEDIFSKETAYKRWQRWLLDKKKPRKVYETMKKYRASVHSASSFRIEEAYEMLERLMNMAPSLFITREIVSEAAIKRALVSILKYNTSMTTVEIAAEAGVHFNNVPRQLRRFKADLARDPSANEVYETLLRGVNSPKDVHIMSDSPS